MKLTPKQWLEIRTKYETGVGVRELSRQYDCDAGNISKRAKKECWVLGLIQQDVIEKTEAIQKVIDTSTTITTKIQQNQVSVVDDIIINDLKLKNKAKTVQNEIMDTIRLATETSKQLIANSENGMYVKSHGSKGTVFASITEIIPHLASGISAVNSIVKDDKPTVVVNPQTNTQINVTSDKDPAQVYEEMIKGS